MFKKLFDIDYKIFILLLLSASMLVNLVIYCVSKNIDTAKEIKAVKIQNDSLTKKVNEIDSNVLFIPTSK